MSLSSTSSPRAAGRVGHPVEVELTDRLASCAAAAVAGECTVAS